MEGDRSHERRISTVEANYASLSNSMGKIEGYLGKLFDQTGDIKTGLALVVQNQADMKDYQIKCDSDRADMKTQLDNVTGFQARTMKVASMVSGTVAFCLTAGIEWFRK